MRLQEWKRITKTDHPDLPEWGEKVVDPINRQMEQVATLAQGNITFGDNHLAEVRTLEIAHDVVTPVRLNELKRNPIGVAVIWSTHFDYHRLAAQMSPTDALTVEVKVKWDSEPTENPTVTLVFFGG